MTSTSARDNIIAGRFDIGGRQLFLECYGQGTPTVIIERGMGGASTNDLSWDAVRDALIPTMRVCLYDRANLGRRDPTPALRTAADMVRNARYGEYHISRSLLMFMSGAQCLMLLPPKLLRCPSLFGTLQVLSKHKLYSHSAIYPWQL